MSQRTKQQRKQFLLNLHLFDRPLHPELFRLHRTEAADRRAYSAQVHLTDAGHVVEFDAGGGRRLTEILINQSDHPQLELPQNGLIEEVQCRGEAYHEAEVLPGVNYMISTQEEQLPPPLYEATREEILDYAQRRELMWVDVPGDLTGEPGGRGRFLGVLDVERRANELLVQSFHLFDEFQMVVKTQGIVEVVRKGR